MSSDRILLTVLGVNSTIKINLQGQNVCAKMHHIIAVDLITRCKCSIEEILPTPNFNVMNMNSLGLICRVDPKNRIVK